MRRGRLVGAERLARQSTPPAARSARPSPCRSRASCGTAACRAARSRDSSGDLAIRLPEEPRVAQPRGDDALGVARDGALVVGLGVDDGEKRVLQLAVLALDRKVVLMMNQRRRQHFLGQLEELERERAGDDRRILDQIGHFEQQPDSLWTVRLTRPCRRCALASSSRAILLCRSAALEDDEVLEQPGAVLVERSHLDRAARAAARRQEPVAVGDGAGRDVLHLAGLRRGRARDRERHDAAAVQNSIQRIGRPNSRSPRPSSSIASQCIAFGKLTARAACRASTSGSTSTVGLAALPPAEREVLALRRLDALERADVDALLRREARRPPASACRPA